MARQTSVTNFCQRVGSIRGLLLSGLRRHLSETTLQRSVLLGLDATVSISVGKHLNLHESELHVSTSIHLFSPTLLLHITALSSSNSIARNSFTTSSPFHFSNAHFPVRLWAQKPLSSVAFTLTGSALCSPQDEQLCPYAYFCA